MLHKLLRINPMFDSDHLQLHILHFYRNKLFQHILNIIYLHIQHIDYQRLVQMRLDLKYILLFILHNHRNSFNIIHFITMCDSYH